MKILLLGKNGQVGWELQRTLAVLGSVTALGRQDLDLMNLGMVREKVREVNPEVIINAAAYTAVDKAEEEPEKAMVINGVLPAILAEEAKKSGGILIHYSTDYVFDGKKKTPYNEEDIPEPVNVYGKTKLIGEENIQQSEAAHIILRTSWIYGLRGNNFLLTMQKVMKERKEIRVVNDQMGSPTWSRMIAEATAQLLAKGFENLKEKCGLYHLTAHGYTSWFGFAQAILSLAEPPMNETGLIPILSNQYCMTANRPANSCLSNDKINEQLDVFMPCWLNMLKLAVQDK